jgi:hypothetical protein
MALVRVAPSTWDNYKLVTYPSPDDIVGMSCVDSCCASGIAASPKSKYWPISDASEVAMMAGRPLRTRSWTKRGSSTD